MPRKAKLYTSESAFDKAVEMLEAHFNVEAPAKWCEKEKVLSGENEGKFVLPLPDHGSFKANHMFSSTTDFNAKWLDTVVVEEGEE
jgi:hypothetical protein